MATQALMNIAEHYSKVHGSYCNWDQTVNLEPPKSWSKPIPEEDRFVRDYYNSLQYTLYEIGHPETIDRTFKPRSEPTKEQANVVFLSSPVECIGIVLEGGKTLPDAFHLVFSPSWLSKIPTEEDENLYTLWLHKSISFHANGQTFIDEYQPPRKVTYFVNYFTENTTSGQRNDGPEIERGLECPMSSSVALCHMVDDKVWTRDVMANVGMAIPETVAFRRKNLRPLISSKGKMHTVDFEEFASLDKNTIENEITQFCQRMHSAGIEKIVVKPSGPQFLGSVGVSFHSVTDVPSVVRAAEELLAEISEGNSVLVEQFVEPIIPIMDSDGTAPPWLADEQMGFRCRATVLRDHDDTPVTTLINCAIGNKKLPINGDNSVCQTLDTTLIAYGVTDPDERRSLELDIRTQSADVLKMIIEREKQIPAELRGELRGQTDVIGIDMIVTKRRGKLIPVGIEVNSHDCTINTQIFDFINHFGRTMLPQMYGRSVHPGMNPPKCMPEEEIEEVSLHMKKLETDSEKDLDTMDNKETEMVHHPVLGYMSKALQQRRVRIQETRYYCGDIIGMSIRPFVRTMITRSQRYLIVGKKMLVIGAGGISKKKIWPDAAAYGVKLYMVDSDPDHYCKDIVHKFIYYDFSDHTQDTTHASNIFNMLQSSAVEVDGCLTFWEDCVPLTALVNQLLGTRGLTYEGAQNGKVKSRTQNVLTTRRGDIPHWPRSFLYSGKSHHIASDADIALVSESIVFPAILKLEHGSSAVGVTIVNNKEEMMDKYEKISHALCKDEDYGGIGLGFGNSMLAMEFFGGSEHDIDVVIYDRKLVAAFISDNGPTNIPSFTETASIMPSSIPLDKQSQLIVAAYQCCVEIGLSDGVFNVEMKMTETGPKLIEINARMGGFYLRDWIRRLYGVDLVLCCLMIAGNIKPFVPKHPTNEQLMGIMVVPSAHRHLHEDDIYIERLKEMESDGDITWADIGDGDEMMPGQFEEPTGNICVSAQTVPEAKRKLMNVCKELNIDKDVYQVSQFIKYF